MFFIPNVSDGLKSSTIVVTEDLPNNNIKVKKVRVLAHGIIHRVADTFDSVPNVVLWVKYKETFLMPPEYWRRGAGV